MALVCAGVGSGLMGEPFLHAESANKANFVVGYVDPAAGVHASCTSHSRGHPVWVPNRRTCQPSVTWAKTPQESRDFSTVRHLGKDTPNSSKGPVVSGHGQRHPRLVQESSDLSAVRHLGKDTPN
ncbi:hypothetical protein BU16DRAFT_554196 [Lophium mytilinum]|uniref:Uncharacterized protein n=1 Tax=Lophium mytilinum TaxID=390894 RepID=A0A6A6REG0_9PEZI|nr:hypothetical protein BU16DRAFT_554196 [Lophium mytilinum]